MSFRLVDVAIGLVLLVSVVDGARVGLLRVTLSTLILATAVGLAVAMEGEMTKAALEITRFPHEVSRALALAEVVLVAEALLTLGMRILVGRLPHPEDGWFKALSALAGAVVGIGRGVVAATLGVALMILISLGGPLDDEVDASVIGSQLIVAAMQLERDAPLGGRLFDVRFAGTTEVPLGTPNDLKAARDERVERTLASLANAERRARGLPELTVDPRLSEIARRHSEEMLRLGYFGHRSPITGLAEDRLRDAGIDIERVHEVIVVGSSTLVIDIRVADSPLEGGQMLDPLVRRMGIGALDAGPYGLVVTELYATPR